MSRLRAALSITALNHEHHQASVYLREMDTQIACVWLNVRNIRLGGSSQADKNAQYLVPPQTQSTEETRLLEVMRVLTFGKGVGWHWEES